MSDNGNGRPDMGLFKVVFAADPIVIEIHVISEEDNFQKAVTKALNFIEDDYPNLTDKYIRSVHRVCSSDFLAL